MTPMPWHLSAVGLPMGVRPPGKPTGSGITIAILDTGIDATHPELIGRVVAAFEVDANDDLVAIPHTANHDFHGHGTLMAGPIASSDPDTGVAPGVNLVSVIFPQHATNISRLTRSLRAVVRKIEQGKLAVNLVSLSAGWVVTDPTDRLVFRDLICRLLEAGTLMIAAIGNATATNRTPWCPGDLPEAIAVGAMNEHGEVASFSLSGPCPEEQGRTKPDMVAPGTRIRTTRSGGGSAFIAGTSPAAAIVSATAALHLEQLLQAPEDLRLLLLTTCISLPVPGSLQGAGLVQAPQP